MNFKNIAYTVVVLMVTIVIITSAVLPIVETAQLEQRTEANNTTMKYSSVSTSDGVDVSIVYDSNNTNPITVNDYTVPIESNGVGLISCSDSFAIYKFGTHAYLDVIVSDSAVKYKALEVTLQNGTISFIETTNNTEIEGVISGTVLYAASSGDYGEFYSTGDIYFSPGAIVYQIHNSSSSLNEVDGDGHLSVGGLYKYEVSSELVSTDVLLPSLEGQDPEKLTSQKLSKSFTYDDVKDLYKATNTSATLTATYDSVDYSRNISLSMFAPIEYTYISDSNSVNSVMLGLIPILLFMVPIMIVIRFIAGRND